MCAATCDQAFMSKPAPRTRPAKRTSAPATRSSQQAPPTVSGRWLASAVGIVIVGALACLWAALCLVFWQGSWQLLYHPTAPVTRTPASAGIAFEDVQFDSGDNGLPQLRGWWIPGTSQGPRTAIYLHGATGNLSDTVSHLARLHAAGLNVLAFDYRGYGQSSFVHPSEKRWREDAEAAIRYLSDTRHIPVGALILAGTGLGANLALQVGADHHELAGVILEDPIEAPANAIFRDPRARLVPARLLVSDRWQSDPAAANLAIPSLWIFRQSETHAPAAYDHVKSRKMIVWLARPPTADTDYADALSHWLAELGSGAVSAGYRGAGP